MHMSGLPRNLSKKFWEPDRALQGPSWTLWVHVVRPIKDTMGVCHEAHFGSPLFCPVSKLYFRENRDTNLCARTWALWCEARVLPIFLLFLTLPFFHVFFIVSIVSYKPANTLKS